MKTKNKNNNNLKITLHLRHTRPNVQWNRETTLMKQWLTQNSLKWIPQKWTLFAGNLVVCLRFCFSILLLFVEQKRKEKKTLNFSSFFFFFDVVSVKLVAQVSPLKRSANGKLYANEKEYYTQCDDDTFDSSVGDDTLTEIGMCECARRSGAVLCTLSAACECDMLKFYLAFT